MHLASSSVTTPDVPPSNPAPPDPRRLAIVGDRENHAYVRAILLGRGVPPQELGDRLNDVVEMSMRAKRFPVEDPAAGRLYMGGIARHIGIRAAKDRDDDVEDESLEDHEAAARPEVAPEQRDLARVVEQEGRRLFPRTFPWYVRHRLLGETLKSIGDSEGVSPGHVRKEVSVIQRMLPQALKASGIVGMLVLAFFVQREWRKHTGYGEGPLTATRTQDDRRYDASTLRTRARSAFRAEAYQACIDDLDAAKSLDSGQEPPEARDLRRAAMQRLLSRDAFENEAKPGR